MQKVKVRMMCIIITSSFIKIRDLDDDGDENANKT